MSREFVYRTKQAFTQPIYEWLAEGGQLRPLVEDIDKYDFVDQRQLEHAKRSPNAFLYCLLCFDLWYKMFILRASPRDVLRTA